MNMPFISVNRSPAEAGVSEGYHASFGIEVPFIPALRALDFGAGGDSKADHIDQIVRRQHRFVSDLANARELTTGAVAFDLRFVTLPSSQWTDRSSIRIFFFGKIAHQDLNETRQLGLRLWRKFASHFPVEDPFGFPLRPLNEVEFERWKFPFPTATLPRENLIEIRKYEDHDLMSGEHSQIGYCPHPFQPALDVSAMGRFLETLSRQSQPCVTSVCLGPTSLLQSEHQVIDELLTNYADLLQKAREKHAWIARQRERHLEAMHQVYGQLLDLRDHLFLLKIQVIGAHHPPTDVVEALGSELVRNVPNEPRRWARRIPDNDLDLRLALRNFHWFEHEPWGDRARDQRLRRIRYLAGAYEALGAFRLPIPPLSGYLPGVPVRDEPFVLPDLPVDELPAPAFCKPEGTHLNKAAPQATSKDLVIPLGDIIHRGQVSGATFHITLDELNRHALIAGVTGSGKTNTCLHLLSELWDRYHVPFLVLYPIDKPDYRQLLADDRVADTLLVFTLGDENVAPFRFNPFAVPRGILLRTHMSRLLRCFKAAYVLQDPLPAIYRSALRRVYQDAGWDLITAKGGGIGAGPTTPHLSDFYAAIVKSAEEMAAKYGSDTRMNLRQASEIRIRDLRDNLGHVLDVPGSPSFTELLTRPTVMELGRLGSPEDVALVMGFLLTLVSEEMEGRFKQSGTSHTAGQIHLTLVEEAHRLMAAGHHGSERISDPRESGGEDFSNLLAEVRGYGEGILIAEQIPSGLIPAAIGNTHVKVMHQLEDASSFNLFSDILNFDERQRKYARGLKQGEVLVRTTNGIPVHVRVTNYSEAMRARELTRILQGLPATDVSDDGITRFMDGRFAIPPRNVTDHVHGAGCWSTPKACSYFVRSQSISAEAFEQDCRTIVSISRDMAVEHVDQKQARIISVGANRLHAASWITDPLAVYCYLFRIASVRRSKHPIGQAHPLVREAIKRVRAEAARRTSQ